MSDFKSKLLENRTAEYTEGFNAAMDGANKNSNPNHPQFNNYEYTQWNAGFDDFIRFKDLLK